MKRTFTFLFAALFAFVGVWAQLPVTSTAPADGKWNADTKWYTLQVKGAYVSLHNADGNANLMLNNSTLSKNAQSLWCVVGSEADGYQFYNLASGTSKVLGATGTDGAGRMTMYDAAGVVDGVTYRFDINIKEMDGDNVNVYVKKQGSDYEWWNSRDNYLSYWNNTAGYGNEGSKCIFAEVDLADFVADYKTSAKSALDMLGSLFEVEVTDAKAAVDAVTATGVDAFAAVDAAIDANMPEEAQRLTFRNGEINVNSVRYNNYLTVNMATGKGYGTRNFSAQNATWTLKYSGGFCLYNEVNKVYLGAPSANGALSKASTAAYTFEVIEDNMVELKANGQTLHLNNHAGNFLSNHDGDDPASRWYVETYDYEAELDALKAANADKHDDVPALGQYPTSAYNALVEATTFVEAAEAIDAFNASLNIPVYFITSAWDNGYSAGSAILYNGSGWRWAAANKFDKQMWMTIPGYTKADVPVVDAYDANGTSYAICDYLTGTKMRDKDVQIVKIDGWEGAYSLQYNSDGENLDAAQHAKDDGTLTNWKAASVDDCQASAWRVEYMGASYDLGKLTDEHIAALAKLQATCDANEGLKDVTFGTALGQYSGSKGDLVAALAAAEVIFAKDVVELANMEVSAIEAAEAAVVAGAAKITFNAPVYGQYFRVVYDYGGNVGKLYMQGTASSVKGVAFTNETAAASIWQYRDGSLYSYTEGKNLREVSGDRGLSDTQTAVTFSASPRAKGKFNIACTSYLHANSSNGSYYTDHCDSDGGHAAHDFILEEVQETELPALKALCDEFTTQATEFAALGDGEALSVLLAIKAQWETVNADVQALSAKIAANELVLKSEVQDAKGMMKSFQDVIKEYTNSYAPAVKEAQGLLAQLEKGSEDYESLAGAIAEFGKVTPESWFDMASYMLNQAVKNLCDIDTKEVVEGTEWGEAYLEIDGERYPVIENADLKIGEDSPEAWGMSLWATEEENVFEYDKVNGVLKFTATDARFVEDKSGKKDNAAYLQKQGEFATGKYRLTGKAYYKNAVNAEKSCGYMFVDKQKIPVMAVTGDVALGAEHELVYEFTAQSTVQYGMIFNGSFTVGYSCEFENPGDEFVVGGFKIEMIEMFESPSLREEFQTAYSWLDMSTQSMAGFANIQHKQYYPAFEALHPAYEALLAEVNAIYDAMEAGQKVLKAKVAKATEDMKKMEAEMSPVIDYAMSDEYQLTIDSATTKQMPKFMEESNAYKAMDEAVKAAKELSEVTEVAQLQAKVAAIKKAIADALAQIPTKITLDKDEVVLNGEPTVQLTATVEGSETADKSVFWESDNEEVVTVENGLVTVVGKIGEAYITAYSIHKSVSAECYINVTALPTGIDGFEVKVETVIYDIHGRQVEKMEKGFYIVNGKKVLVK